MRVLSGHPMSLLAFAISILAAGIWCLLKTPIEWFPTAEYPEISITAAWPGASPLSVERYVVAPIERTIQGVPGTVRVESYSVAGQGRLRIRISREIGISTYRVDLGERLAFLRSALPKGVVPRIERSVPDELRDQRGFLSLQLIGPLSGADLRRIAEERIASQFRNLPGIAGVSVEGGLRQEIRVSVQRGRLLHYGIPAERLSGVLAASIEDTSFGTFHQKGWSGLLFQKGIDNLSDLRNLVLRTSPDGTTPVRLRDVGTVSIADGPYQDLSRVDGLPVVTLTLDRVSGSHLLRITDQVHNSLKRLREELPSGVRLLVAHDSSEPVRQDLRQLSFRGAAGAFFMVGVFLALLRRWYPVLLSLAGASIVLSITILAMCCLDLSLNLLTIIALALVFSFFMATAFLVLEHEGNRRHRLQREDSASPSIGRPLLGGTLSSVIALVPLVYFSDHLAEILTPVALLVGIGLLVSLLSALALIPTLNGIAPRIQPASAPPYRQQCIFRCLDLPNAVAGSRPRLALVSLLLLLGVPIWLLPERLPEEGRGFPAIYNQALGSEGGLRIRRALEIALGGVLRPFFQRLDLGKFWEIPQQEEIQVRIQLPPGSGSDHADAVIRSFEALALHSPHVRRTFVHVTTDVALLRVQLLRRALRSQDAYWVREALIDRALELSGVDVRVTGLVSTGFSSGAGDGLADFAVAVYGPSYEKLGEVSNAFAAQLKRDPRVRDVDTNSGLHGSAVARESILVRWDAAAEAWSGASTRDVIAQVRATLADPTPTTYMFSHLGRLPLRLVAGDGAPIPANDWIFEPLHVADARGFRLAGLGHFSLEAQPTTIERMDQQYRRYIRILYRGPTLLGEKFIRRNIKSFPLPPAYRLEQVEFRALDRQGVFRILLILLGALFLVYLAMAAVFESWRLPLLFAACLPTAAIGLAVGFLWTKAEFAEGALLGLILLVGSAVNNCILLLNHFRCICAHRESTSQRLLIRKAARDKLRSMWGTTLCLIAGLIPMILFSDPGEFWTGFSVSMAGGLIGSTMLAPATIIALISWKDRPANCIK